jgi:hypothetical protein
MFIFFYYKFSFLVKELGLLIFGKTIKYAEIGPIITGRSSYYSSSFICHPSHFIYSLPPC